MATTLRERLIELVAGTEQDRAAIVKARKSAGLITTDQQIAQELQFQTDLLAGLNLFLGMIATVITTEAIARAEQNQNEK